MGLEFPLVVSRHKVLTLCTAEAYDSRSPIIKDLTTPDKVYSRPEAPDAMLIGTGDHGDPTTEPDDMPDGADSADDDQHRGRRRVVHRLRPRNLHSVLGKPVE